MLANRSNIHHRLALLWRFVILAPDTKLQTYLLTYLYRATDKDSLVH